MNSQLQNMEDLKLILSTDKRFWAAGAFIGTALFVWLATTTWRVEPAPSPERYKYVKVQEEEKVNILIKDFNVLLKQSEEERGYLRDSIYRFQSDLNAHKEEFDWQVNSLFKKLDDITENIDVLANKVGTSKVHSTKLNERLRLNKRKGRAKKVAVN